MQLDTPISLTASDSAAHESNSPRKLGHRPADSLCDFRVRNLTLVGSGLRNNVQVFACFDDPGAGVVVGVVAVVDRVLEHCGLPTVLEITVPGVASRVTVINKKK